MPSYYAVRLGRVPGIYSTWDDCKKQTEGFKGAKFKKFPTEKEALEFISNSDSSASTQSHTQAQSSGTSTGTESKKRKIKSDPTEGHFLCSSIAEQHFYSDQRHANNFPLPERGKTDLAAMNIEPSPKRKKMAKIKTEKPTKTSQIESSPIKTSPINEKNENEIMADKIIKNLELMLAEACLAEYGISTSSDFSFGGRKVSVYTDGACSGNGQANSAAGIGVFWGPQHPLNSGKKLLGVQTNNRAEITAAIVALSQAIVYKAGEVSIYTDSKFMINCMISWIPKWKRNGWKTLAKQPVKNIEDLQRLDELCTRMKTNWIYCPGHKGVYGNEEADKLATGSVERTPSR